MKLFFTLLLAATLPVSARACSCPNIEHACQAYRRAPIIFIGVVTNIRAENGASDYDSDSHQVAFAIEESFKGTSDESITVEWVHKRRSSCPSTTAEFKLGDKFLVWAFEGENGDAVVSDCTPTRRIEDATQFVSELRELKNGGGPTYIFGSVYRNRYLANGASPEELAHSSSLPLSGTQVLVTSADDTHSTVTDQKGRFVVPLPHAGRYRITADLPSYFDHQELDQGFDLEEHECAYVPLPTQYSFRFRGRVVDAHGVPQAGVPVTLLPAATLRGSLDASGFTHDDGSYNLTAAEPGDYLIAINWDENPSAESPFATAFYPGVRELASGTVVHTQENGEVTLSDFHLADPVKCTAQVEVDEPDGRPTKNAKILTKYSPAQFWHEVADVTSNGRVTVTIVGPGATYMVASQTLSSQEYLRSEEKSISSCPSKPLHFQLKTRMRLTEP